ncbi:protoheme IX farnesyltransferase [Amphritea atlantica]|uniref:Protoheme IX farnesyltransferase n=1 Tax=Amphritea atlantica TaxID=355243 RepID=A0A1H9LJA1_9GAMM|nr:heme o synthase [Amphritea atlantica]SER11470.1 protoheme IX farnesyltransferase [Amphritea atlantica]
MNNSLQRVFHSPFALCRDYLELCKLRVVAVMLLTAIVGMCLATPELPPIATMISATLGIGLMASGAAAVNHVMDRNIDAKMARTHRRPLPQGKIDETRALLFAALLSLSGITVLIFWTNLLTAWLTLGALIGYALIYTMLLKRATPLNIVIGGIAGAAPPLLGWVAVTGRIEPDSLLLVLIIFAWTPPHFWALCIHKKDDYARAGVPMLPVTHGEGYTRLQILLYTVLMVLTTLFPFMTGMSGLIYLIGVTLLNLRFFQWAVRVYMANDSTAPMSMFWFSVKYIMWLFVVLLVDHYVIGLH